MEKLPEIVNKSQGFNIKTIGGSILAVAGTLFTWLFGEWDLIFQVLATMMVLDYATGVIVAFIEGEADSKVGFKGILKKVLKLFILIIGVLLDRLLSTEWIFRIAVCYFLIGNEGLSILENIGKTGIKIPNKLKDALVQLTKEEDVEQGEIDK